MSGSCASAPLRVFLDRRDVEGCARRRSGGAPVRVLWPRLFDTRSRAGELGGMSLRGRPSPRGAGSVYRSALDSCGFSGRGCPRVLAAGGFDVHLLGEGGQQPGLPFGLAGEDGCAACAGEVEDGPKFHEPVEPVEAERVLFPAGARAAARCP